MPCNVLRTVPKYLETKTHQVLFPSVIDDKIDAEQFPWQYLFLFSYVFNVKPTIQRSFSGRHNTCWFRHSRQVKFSVNWPHGKINFTIGWWSHKLSLIANNWAIQKIKHVSTPHELQRFIWHWVHPSSSHKTTSVIRDRPSHKTASVIWDGLSAMTVAGHNDTRFINTSQNKKTKINVLATRIQPHWRHAQ